MRAEDLRAVLDRRPFKPLRLHISSGQHVDILHPEMAVLTRSTVFVVEGDPKSRIGERAAWYNLIHVVKITEVARGNGRSKRHRSR